MNWNMWVRQIHRWLSIIFTAIVVAIFIALGVGKEPAQWVYFLPLLPLALLMLTGLYMFVLPYAARWRSARRIRIAMSKMTRQDVQPSRRKSQRRLAAKTAAAKPVLLSGGNPQIAKGDGDAPVQAYIAAMPGWKSDVGRRLDAIIVRTLPDVRKAVKWNSPFYGIEGQGWFMGLHVFTRYVKVAFFRGASLRPVPPGPSKDKDTRYIDIHEDDELDEAQIATG